MKKETKNKLKKLKEEILNNNLVIRNVGNPHIAEFSFERRREGINLRDDDLEYDLNDDFNIIFGRKMYNSLEYMSEAIYNTSPHTLIWEHEVFGLLIIMIIDAIIEKEISIEEIDTTLIEKKLNVDEDLDDIIEDELEYDLEDREAKEKEWQKSFDEEFEGENDEVWEDWSDDDLEDNREDELDVYYEFDIEDYNKDGIPNDDVLYQHSNFDRHYISIIDKKTIFIEIRY